MKTYTLDIQELREYQGGHLGWFSKGHQDKNEFVMEIVTNHDTTIPDLGPLEQRTRHEYWRCVPAGDDGFTFTRPTSPGTRGAFPVTVVED